MGNIHLVTGYAGKAHVKAADHGSLHAAIFGSGHYVLNRGSKFATTIISNNSIRVADGDIIMQGRHIRMDEGTYVDLSVENGSQGMFRNDLIAVRYTKDSITGIEDCNLVVIKGTANAEKATDPEYTSGDIINDHVLIAEMPLYRIPLNGLNVQSLVPLFEEASLLADGSVTKEKIAPGATYNAATVSLVASGWASQTQTVSVDGVTSTNLVIVSPNSASFVPYSEAVVYCSGQGNGTLTFSCEEVPSENLTVNVLILR